MFGPKRPPSGWTQEWRSIYIYTVYMETDISVPHNLYCYVGIYNIGRTALGIEFV